MGEGKLSQLKLYERVDQEATLGDMGIKRGELLLLSARVGIPFLGTVPVLFVC